MSSDLQWWLHSASDNTLHSSLWYLRSGWHTSICMFSGKYSSDKKKARDSFAIWYTIYRGFPCGSVGREFTCNVGDLRLIPGLGRSPREGNGYPLQYSGLENFMSCVVHGVAKSQTWLSDFHFHFQTLCRELSIKLTKSRTGKKWYLNLAFEL